MFISASMYQILLRAYQNDDLGQEIHHSPRAQHLSSTNLSIQMSLHRILELGTQKTRLLGFRPEHDSGGAGLEILLFGLPCASTWLTAVFLGVLGSDPMPIQ